MFTIITSLSILIEDSVASKHNVLCLDRTEHSLRVVFVVTNYKQIKNLGKVLIYQYLSNLLCDCHCARIF